MFHRAWCLRRLGAWKYDAGEKDGAGTGFRGMAVVAVDAKLFSDSKVVDAGQAAAESPVAPAEDCDLNDGRMRGGDKDIRCDAGWDTTNGGTSRERARWGPPGRSFP